MPINDHAPPFATQRWAPFSRADAVAIALREWRLFGQPVDDDPPGTRPEPAPDQKPERMAGLWQRVGEYWWTGMNPGAQESSWTGKHDEYGQIFPANVDGDFAWSAAFLCYVLRVAGAGPDFPYSSNHSTYINVGARGYNPLLRAYPPETYAPQLGDLVCTGRGRTAGMRFSDLPTDGDFPSHCDMVVAIGPGQMTVIGGNVDDAVTTKHIPVTADGKLATPDGRVLDSRFPWMAILKINYAV